MVVNVKELSNLLIQAENTRQAIQPLVKIAPELTVKDAYYVQLETIKHKVNQGQRIVGKKIGITSEAVQNLFKINEPDYGHLLDSMKVENGAEISLSKVMQPKVEAEIAFILKEDLKGPNVTAEDVLRATDYVLPSLEIVDSRIENWNITLPDTVADNASCGLFVLGGNPVKVDEVDLLEVGMTLYRNAEVANTGKGSAVVGGPANCVAWLANKLSEFGISLNAGEVILSGALSGMIEAKAGEEFRAVFDHLGEVSAKFV